jgi:hypothetical protein
VDVFLPIFRALDEARVRYVVVGGLAVLLHGHLRFTADVDLAVDLAPDAAARAVAALGSIGLRPRAAVDPAGFADPGIRAAWRAEKGMVVFSMCDPDNPTREVDLFTESPLDFERLWQDAKRVVLGGIPVPVASIEHLCAMKRASGRPKDLDDVRALERIAREQPPA